LLVCLVPALAAPLAAVGCADESGDRYVHYRIRHDAMRPTYSLGDGLVAVDPAAYDGAGPRVGDVVLFHAPQGWRTGTCGAPREPGAACRRPTARGPTRLLLRVIAKPGDTVAFRRGSALVNGKPETRREPITGRDCKACDLPREVTVPPGHLFLAGDNRARARDSRTFGPIPERSVIGKAVGFSAD
jgi:signal peptidase I